MGGRVGLISHSSIIFYNYIYMARSSGRGFCVEDGRITRDYVESIIEYICCHYNTQ